MIVSFIVAMGHNRVIGIENRLPWKMPADMQWFRRQTMGKPMVMGRKTFESFGAKPLPGRQNIVVTHDKSYEAEGATVVHSVDEALSAAGDVEEVMIIGGSGIFEQTLPRAGRLYLTFIDADFDGDAWFPDYEHEAWRVAERQDFPADEKNPYPYSFVILER